MEHLVLVGNGIAGHSALQEVLKSDTPFKITVVYDEDPRTYMRTQLIPYTLGLVSDEKFFMTARDFYESHGIRAIAATLVRLNPEDASLILSNGETIHYDRLILATGAYNFVPPMPCLGHSTLQSVDSWTIDEAKGVYTMRTLKDASRIRRHMKSAKKAVVVGGGLLGLEAASDLLDQGLDVTVVEFAPRLLPRQLDEKSSQFLQTQAEEYGLTFLLGTSVKQLQFDDDALVGLTLLSGEFLECDMLLMSIGIRPHLAPYEGVLKTQRGIVTDSTLATSLPKVWACGDAVEREGMVYGTWSFAMQSGKLAGKNATGCCDALKPYILNTLFHSLGCKVFSTGQVHFDDPELRTYETGDYHKDYIKLFFKENHLVAAVLMGNTAAAMKLSKAIERHMQVQDALASFCANPLSQKGTPVP
ncbi:Nitrite reductase [NAD(P)H] large subunit [Clostridiaceae bacterium JG1575]|nr:Nitrite reductase [NAD(P)H] large subunit [Clostridiaceae bacterium JG1575]